MLKTKSSKLLLVDIKANSSIHEIGNGRAQNNQKCLIFIVVPRVRVEYQIIRIS